MTFISNNFFSVITKNSNWESGNNKYIMNETKTYNELSAKFQHMNDNLSVKAASQAATD